jgi:hypothetical protein
MSANDPDTRPRGVMKFAARETPAAAAMAGPHEALTNAL